MEASARHWFKQVPEDLETADTLLRSRRYQYVVFFCHLALEKFKGCVAENTGRTPPRSHDLLHLATLAGLLLPLDHGTFFDHWNRDDMEARYPLGRIRFARRMADEYLDKTRKALEWLQQERTSSA